MSQEGIIKFNCYWEPGPALSSTEVQPLVSARKILYGLGLVGAYGDGLGFGNLSIRIPSADQQFIITGSQTGHWPVLTAEHCSRVVEFDLNANRLACRGPVRASSESLSHGAAYLADPGIQAVVHIHHPGLWKKNISKWPTTPMKAAYGTPALARAILAILSTTQPRHGIIVLGGHPDGLLAVGKDMPQAVNWIIQALREG